MLAEFFIALSAVCFTLLGLWLVAVQSRQAEWRGSQPQRRRAYVVALHFSLPGVTGLLVLVNPGSGGLWRVSAGVAAGGGVVLLSRLRAPAAGRLGLAAYLAAITAWVVIVILAIKPHLIGLMSFPIAPERVVAVLLTGLVFLGVNVAWLLMFGNAEPRLPAGRWPSLGDLFAEAGHDPPACPPVQIRSWLREVLACR